MVAEVEAAAFGLDADAVSDPVRSAFGFHVIRVTEKQEETTQPLEEVREAIENTLKNEQATARATALGRAIAAEVSTPEELERAAAARGLELQESGFVAAGEPILGLGFAPRVSAEAFRMEEGTVAGPIQTPTGPAFVTVIDRQEPIIPPLEDVRDDVRRDVLRRKALEHARQRADDAAEPPWQDGRRLPGGRRRPPSSPSSHERADRTGRRVPGGRRQSGPRARRVRRCRWAAVSDVLETGGDALAVLHLVEREDVTTEQIAEARDTLRAELLQSRQNEFYSSYMSQVQQRLSIDIDYEALDLAVGA